MTIRINPAPLPPALEGDEIARQVFGMIAVGYMPTAEMLKDIVDFRQPNGLGRTFTAMVILATQAVRVVSADVLPIRPPPPLEIPPAPEPPPEAKIVKKVVTKVVERPVEIRVPVERLTDKAIAKVVDQILGDIGAAAMTAKAEKRAFGVRDLRPIIERGLR